jgi:hypothetical protein
MLVPTRALPRALLGANASLAQALFVFSTFENLSPRPSRARARAPNPGRRSRTQGRAHAPLQPFPVLGEVSIEGLRVVLVGHCTAAVCLSPLLQLSKS